MKQYKMKMPKYLVKKCKVLDRVNKYSWMKIQDRIVS